eukprot:UN28482
MGAGMCLHKDTVILNEDEITQELLCKKLLDEYYKNYEKDNEDHYNSVALYCEIKMDEILSATKVLNRYPNIVRVRVVCSLFDKLCESFTDQYQIIQAMKRILFSALSIDYPNADIIHDGDISMEWTTEHILKEKMYFESYLEIKKQIDWINSRGSAAFLREKSIMAKRLMLSVTKKWQLSVLTGFFQTWVKWLKTRKMLIRKMQSKCVSFRVNPKPFFLSWRRISDKEREDRLYHQVIDLRMKFAVQSDEVLQWKSKYNTEVERSEMICEDATLAKIELKKIQRNNRKDKQAAIKF